MTDTASLSYTARLLCYGFMQDAVHSQVSELVNTCHSVAKEAGWWENTQERDVPRLLMLCVSELAEAMEGHRKGRMDDHLPGRSMLEVELADALIRILDMAGGLNLDVPGALRDKLIYNANREDHKKENRVANGGKKY